MVAPPPPLVKRLEANGMEFPSKHPRPPNKEHSPQKKYISSPPFRTPLLEQVTQTSSDSTSSAMAQYYLTRFGNESTEETRRELAWPHLLRAAELGRPDAELLVAHAHLSPGAQQTETW